MRTNIDIDDTLMAEAMARGGLRTKREAVHAALEEFVRFRRQRSILDHFGLLAPDGWDGDLDVMRTDIDE